jgi:ATP-binding cassette subfamily F protein 3
MLFGSEQFEGKSEPGYNVVTSFYAQHQLESLSKESSALEELQVFAPEESDTYLRSLLGAFLLKGDEVFKKIKVLSGGERARVALAKTILAKANFLLLDEPTNHLDMQSVNVLVDVLNRYEGSYVVVSHDRYFLSRIANKIWYIEDHLLKEYPGTYVEFDQYMELKKVKEKENERSKNAATKIEKKEVKVEQPANSSNKKEKQKLEQKAKKIEEQISSLKKNIEELNLKMSQPDILKDMNSVKELQGKTGEVENEIKSLTTEWESIYEQLLSED